VSSTLRAFIFPSIAILLGAYYILFEFGGAAAPQQPPPSRHLFAALSSEHITRIRIRASDMELIVVKQEGRWMLTEPQRAAANQDEVARLITILERAEWSRQLRLEPPERGLGQFGLDTPSLTISIWSENLRTEKSADYTMCFGGTSPSGAKVYANEPGTKDLLLIDAEFVNQVKYFLFVPPLEKGPKARKASSQETTP